MFKTLLQHIHKTFTINFKWQVRRKSTKSRRKFVLPTAKSRRRSSAKALLIILYCQQGRR